MQVVCCNNSGVERLLAPTTLPITRAATARLSSGALTGVRSLAHGIGPPLVGITLSGTTDYALPGLPLVIASLLPIIAAVLLYFVPSDMKERFGDGARGRGVVFDADGFALSDDYSDGFEYDVRPRDGGLGSAGGSASGELEARAGLLSGGSDRRHGGRLSASQSVNSSNDGSGSDHLSLRGI